MINRSSYYRCFRSNKVIFRMLFMWGTNLLFTQLHFYELILFFKKKNAQTLKWWLITAIFPIILLSPINRSFFFFFLEKTFLIHLDEAQALQPEAVWGWCSGCRLWAVIPGGGTSGTALWGKLIHWAVSPSWGICSRGPGNENCWQRETQTLA